MQYSLVVNDVEMIDDVKNIEAIRKEVGMVFQHFNLFPHLTILENLSLGPIWVKKKPKKEAEAVAMNSPSSPPWRRKLSSDPQPS